jgi:hypothetical protein
MAATKYGHLIKKLEYQTDSGEHMTMPVGKDLAGIDLSFAFGYRRGLGMWGGDGGVKHAHPYGEVLLFSGLDYDRPDYLGAEIEIAMGEDDKKYVFDRPTIVVLPAGYPHCPVVTRSVERPFGFLAISLRGEHAMTEPSVQADPEELIQRLELRDLHRTEGGNADLFAWWNGQGREGFTLNFTWAFHTGLGAWHPDDPHVHPADEALLFVGTDPDRPDYLGAEIEIAMGKEREIHVFDTPTVVVAPRGLVHCPLITRRVDSPYMFSAISLNTEHATKWLGGDKGKNQPPPPRD